MLAAHCGPHRLFHIGKLRLLQVGKVGLEQQVAAASQVETQIDLHLREGRQLVEDLVGQEARDGEEDAEQQDDADADGFPAREIEHGVGPFRSEEHTSELQSLMRISYAVFCLKQKNKKKERHR